MTTLTCNYCGEQFERPNTMGPTPKFCCPTHRQRAYEERRLERAARTGTWERQKARR